MLKLVMFFPHFMNMEAKMKNRAGCVEGWFVKWIRVVRAEPFHTV